MSTSSEPAQELADGFAYDYVLTAAFVIIVYDTLLTFPRELKLMWGGKFRLGIVLYVMTRYMLLLVHMNNLIGNNLNITLQVCTDLTHLRDVTYVLFDIGVKGLLIARTYAISHRNRLVLVALVVVALPGVVTNILSVFETCVGTDASTRVIRIESDLNLAFGFAFDTAIITVTLYQTWGLIKIRRGSDITEPMSLSELIVREGILRYILLLSFHVAGVVTNHKIRPTLTGIINPIESSLSAVMLCRFTLDIRHMNLHPHGTCSAHVSPQLTSFQAVTRRVDNAVIDEFGDPLFNESFATSQASRENVPASYQPTSVAFTQSSGERVVDEV